MNILTVEINKQIKYMVCVFSKLKALKHSQKVSPNKSK